MNRERVANRVLDTLQPIRYVNTEGEPIQQIHIFLPEGPTDLAEYLSSNSDYSLILYGNHISYPDPSFLLRAHSALIDPEGQRSIFLPVSHYHSQFRNNPLYWTMVAMGRHFYGYQTPQVVQSYMVSNQYSGTEAYGINRAFLNTISGAQRIPWKTAIIFPEGTRSKDRRLQEINPGGLGSLARLWSPSILLPFGITYENDTGSRGPNIGQRVNLTVGSPFFVPNPLQFDSHEAMYRVAELLPKAMRGYYQHDN